MSLDFLHLSARKRAKKFKHWFDYLMYGAALMGPLALLPQIISIFQTHNVSGLVFVSWILFLLSNILWFVYGLVHKEIPIILTNALGLILNGAGAIGILLYS